MPGTATPQDAELIMKLYDLRREPELRKARNWWLMEFWPNSVDDIMKVANAMGAHVVSFTPSTHKTEDTKRLGAHEVVVSKDLQQMEKQVNSFDSMSGHGFG